MAQLELLIFDMDGLMFDTERISQECWETVGRGYGYTFTKDIFDAITGLDNRRMVEVFIAAYGEEFPFDDILREQRSLMWQRIKEEGVPLKAGLVECLEAGKKRQLKMAVASSSPLDMVLFYLRDAKVEDYFDYVLSGEEIKRGKPYPDVFLAVCQKLGVSPEKALVLEDSMNGLKAAAAGSIRSIWIPDVAVVPQDVVATAWCQAKTLGDVPPMLEIF